MAKSLKWTALIVSSVSIVGAAMISYHAWQLTVPPPDAPQAIDIGRLADEAVPDTGAQPAVIPEFDAAMLCEPPKAFRPWTRWWWPGNAVTPDQLLAQLGKLDDWGVGGVEIQPVDSALEPIKDEAFKDAVDSFDTPGYFANLRTLAQALRNRGMQMDLSNFSGFPGGGRHIRKRDGVMSLLNAIDVVAGSRRIEMKLPRPGLESSTLYNIFFEAVAFRKDFANLERSDLELVGLTAARVIEGRPRRTPFDATSQITVDPASLQDITGVAKDGVFAWDAPPGRWALVATYLAPAAEPPLLYATRVPGFVVDHMRQDALIGHYNHAFGERTGLAPYFGSAIRGIFNDSFEFRAERLAARDIMGEFRKRRGYDLKPYLPILAQDGADNFWFSQILEYEPAPSFRVAPELEARVLHDYNLTLSDLFRERFVSASSSWAQARGLLTRSQLYGPDFDVIRTSGEVDIPETETLAGGGSDLTVKLASSAAALYGKRLVSVEAFAMNNRDHQDTPRRLRGMIDKLFASGVNSIVYHGTPYLLPERYAEAYYGKPGWHPFSAPGNNFSFGTHLSPNNPLWDDYRLLNRYVARAQHLLQAGRPDWDVLIYYPHLGVGYAGRAAYNSMEAFTDAVLPDADGPGGDVITGTPLDGFIPKRRDPRTAWMASTRRILDGLTKSGLGWVWTSGDALLKSAADNGRAVIGSGRYGAIVLPEVEALTPEEARHLSKLASAGVPVYVIGSKPRRQPGLANHQTGDAEVVNAMTRLQEIGAKFFTDPGAAVQDIRARVTPPLQISSTASIHRATRLLPGAASIHFLANMMPEPQTVRLVSGVEANSFWFDAMTGTAVAADARAGGMAEVVIPAYTARFLIEGVSMPESLGATPDLETATTVEDRPLSGWSLVAMTARGERKRPDFVPVDWRRDPELRDAPGPASYETSITMPPDFAMNRHLLDLGLIHGAVTVNVNGKAVDTLISAPFATDITDALRPGTNDIRLAVRVPAQNAYLGLSAHDDRYSQFKSKLKNGGWIGAGIVGPTRLVTLAAGNIHVRKCPR